MSTLDHPLIASILIDRRVEKALDYKIPESLREKLRLGMRVEVPLRHHHCEGTVIALKEASDYPHLQEITKLAQDEVLVLPQLFELARWVSSYYATPLRKVLKTLLPPMVRRNTKEKKVLFIKPLVSLEKMRKETLLLRQKNPLQAEVLDLLLKNPEGMLLSEALQLNVFTKSPILSLQKKKLLELLEISTHTNPKENFEYFLTQPKPLTEEQHIALKAIGDSLEKGVFQTHLLFGVTGSGKTEVYLQAIQKALDLGKNVFFLVPEISLAAQTLERLKSRFSEKIALLHHKLADGEKATLWKEILHGKVRIVVGARSAIFAPLQKVGLIIVDEEHEGAYKQTDEMPCYQGRDVAIMRAKFSMATLVLGSATPSFESFYKAKSGKYTLLTLKERPHAKHASVHLVDMTLEFRKAKGFTLFSELLIDKIKQRLEKGEQTLLFLNRRGYHTAQMCQLCGHSIQCKHCSVSLTYHLGNHILACHLCDYRIPPPQCCPECGNEGGLRFKGAGTELVEKSLHALLPEVRTLRLDADTTGKKGSHESLFKAFRSGKADVLIGTQMIAKGLHFPTLTLAAILYADAALQFPDFRSSEHTFQQIIQVAGRSGRGLLEGEVIIQTQLSQSCLMRHIQSQNYVAFYEEEIESRKLFGFPPFCRLIKIQISSKKESEAQKYGQILRQALIEKLPSSFSIGPLILSGYAKVKDTFRWQFLLKTTGYLSFLKVLEEVDASYKIPAHIYRKVDMDPQQTFF